MLLQAIRDAVEQDGVTDFYVGDKGEFDRMVLNALRIIKAEYPEINYAVVLAYLRKDRQDPDIRPEETVFPEGIGEVPLKFRIDRRNRWMVGQADMVISYTCVSIGGARKFVELAERQKKKIVDLIPTR